MPTPTAHSFNRPVEWALSVLMLIIGLGCFIGEALGARIAGTLIILVGWGLSITQVEVLLTVVGGFGCLALWRNGHWQFGGCTVRNVVCLLRGIVWVQLFMAVVVTLVRTGDLFPVMFVWGGCALLELLSSVISSRDMVKYLFSRTGNATRNAGPV